MRSDKGYVWRFELQSGPQLITTPTYPRFDPFDLDGASRGDPCSTGDGQHVRRTWPQQVGRNSHLFAALCALALRCSDDGLLTWASTLNREYSTPLTDSEVRGVWRSVCRYRARWRASGHQQSFIWKQAAVGRRGGAASGVVRRAGTPLEHDRAPWADQGISRRTWYYRRASEAKSGCTRSQYRQTLKSRRKPIQIDPR